MAAAIALSPTAASAADQGNIDTCDATCRDWNYVESAGNIYELPAVTGADVAACVYEGTAVSATNLNNNKSWPWSVGGPNQKFMEVINKSLTKQGKTAYESVPALGIWWPISAGEIGHVTLIPKMYHSEGAMTWVEYMYDEFNTVNSLEAAVSTETPLAIDIDADYSLVSHPMSAEELAANCS